MIFVAAHICRHRFGVGELVAGDFLDFLAVFGGAPIGDQILDARVLCGSCDNRDRGKSE